MLKHRLRSQLKQQLYNWCFRNRSGGKETGCNQASTAQKIINFTINPNAIAEKGNQ
jgi:hypothetical protein